MGIAKHLVADPLALDTDSRSSSQDLPCQSTQCETPSSAKWPPAHHKTFPVLDDEAVRPATSSWCIFTAEEANAFPLHGQLASALWQLDSSRSKDAPHPFTSIQVWAAPVFRRWHPSLQGLDLTSVTQWQIQSLPSLKDLPSDKWYLSGATALSFSTEHSLNFLANKQGKIKVSYQ